MKKHYYILSNYYKSRSKYEPHQGKKEKARRKKKLTKELLRKHNAQPIKRKGK